MHFEVKDTLLTQFCGGDQLAVKQVKQVLAYVYKLELDLLMLAADEHLLMLGRTAIGGLLLLDAFDGHQLVHNVPVTCLYAMDRFHSFMFRCTSE